MMNFNGTDLEDFLLVTNITGRGVMAHEVETITAPSMDGAYFVGKRVQSRLLEVSYILSGNNEVETRRKLEEINVILDVKEPVPITFADEPNRTYYGIPQASTDNGQIVYTVDGSFTILCADPFKYGEEKGGIFQSDYSSLVNNGATATYPVFSMNVLTPITFAMIRNQTNGEYMMIGQSADDDIQVVNRTELVLDENGSGLADWNTSPVQIDPFIGNITGSFGYDGTGIFVENFGTGEKMHGPAIIREIEPIQDFEVEAMFDTISQRPEDNYRMEVYLFDEGMNVLGKIGINDGNRSFIRRTGVARVGEYVDSNTRYVIGTSNYRKDNLGEIALMYVRIRREGNIFTFYISEVRNGRHYETIERRYIDRAERFMGRLQYVQLFVGNWQDRKRPFRSRVNFVRVRKLNDIVEEDMTPYIAYEGDTITFDHLNGDILINGESRKDIKNFGANYYPLETGVNELVVYPNNSLEVNVAYRERFK